MTPFDFARLRETSDKEALCHEVFGEAHERWTTAGLVALNESQLTVMCVETFFGEILNGGLEQYLFNEAGRYAGLAPAALRRVDLPKYADFLEEALSRCQNVPECNDFGILEDFYELPDADDDQEANEKTEQQFFNLYFANKAEFRDKLFQFIIKNECDFVATR